MRRSAFFCCFLLLLLSANGGAEDLARGEELLAKGKPKEAISGYQALATEGKVSHGLYHNLGCAYLRDQKPKRAALSFFRAMLLSSQEHTSFREAAKLADFGEEQTKQLVAAARAYRLQQPLFAYGSSALWLGLALCLIPLGRWRLAISIPLLFAGLSCLGFGLYFSRLAPRPSTAWVTEEQGVVLLSAPEPPAPSFGPTLPCASWVEILRSREGWHYVKGTAKSASNPGWIPVDKIERILPGPG